MMNTNGVHQTRALLVVACNMFQLHELCPTWKENTNGAAKSRFCHFLFSL